MDMSYCGSEYHFVGNCDKKKKEAEIVDNGSEGKAENGFSWIAVMEEVKTNPVKNLILEICPEL